MEHLNNQPNAASATAQAFNETTRLTYSTPTITSVEFAVEHCFESTQEIKPLASGSTFRVSGQHSLDGVNGSSNSWNEAENNWFYE